MVFSPPNSYCLWHLCWVPGVGIVGPVYLFLMVFSKLQRLTFSPRHCSSLCILPASCRLHTPLIYRMNSPNLRSNYPPPLSTGRQWEMSLTFFFFLPWLHSGSFSTCFQCLVWGHMVESINRRLAASQVQLLTDGVINFLRLIENPHLEGAVKSLLA